MHLTLKEPKRQTLPEINVHARLFGTLEYVNKWFEEGTEKRRRLICVLNYFERR